MEDELLDHVALQCSGVRLELSTAASWLELDVTVTGMIAPGADPSGGEFLFVATSGGQVLESVAATGGPMIEVRPPGVIGAFHAGAASVIRLDLADASAATRPLQVWLPHGGEVEIHALRGDRPIVAAPVSGRRSWWHYGSSISHCLEVDSPLGVWPVAAAHQLDIDVTNLGFAGNAQLDPFVARVMRDGAPDLISLKIGINVAGGDTMKRRAFVPAVHGFLDTLREHLPTTPLLVISPISCPGLETIPGPMSPDPRAPRPTTPAEVAEAEAMGSLTLRTVREVLQQIVTTRTITDPAIRYLDGRELFGPNDIHDLPDGLHPDAAGYRRIADRFALHPTVHDWVSVPQH